MSGTPGGATAQVFDLRPSHLARVIERQSCEQETRPGAVLDDLADAVEAIHQCANLAGFSARPRALIFALSTCARSRDGASVELYDEELADLQNCSTQTVRRQRRDYLREARRLKFDLIGVVEGERVKGRPSEGEDVGGAWHTTPSRYTFIVGGVVERVVAEARATDGWDNLDRKRQREIIRQVAERVYEDIPDAPLRRRKLTRTRPASKEIMTCRKVISGQLQKLRERAARLPAAERERLLAGPEGLRAWWLEVSAEMDALLAPDSPQADESAEDGQLVHLADASDEPAPSPEHAAAWGRIEERLSEPPIRRVELVLLGPESPPGELTVEESEAVRAEACGERAPWE